tara:strand:- start:1148 stop:1546 length:399 start_codon:yes stop_codon:yes gene_type:complete
MKKLSRNEVNVITQEVRNKVNEIKLKDIKEKSKKDKDCINLIKLNNDKKLLNDKISNINIEMKKITESLHKKYNKQYQFSINSYNNNIVNDLNIWVSNDNCGNLYNKIVLMSIDKDLKVNDLIEALVKEYSK